MKRLSFATLPNTCYLLLLAAVWILVGFLGWTAGLEQWTVGARFRARGPLESSARVYYVNRDPAASRHFGKQYFPREYYALAAEALLELGGARTVFLDFVLTDDHLPDIVAADLTYAGNLAMQQLLLRHPGRVVLGAAYNGKRYPFSSYGGGLPDKRAGAFRVTATGASGYDAARNPLPDLPEFPLWCPPIDDPVFGHGGFGTVGLIDTTESLNIGEAVYFVPAYVEVEARAVSLFLVNGMRRWQETVANRSSPGAGAFTARDTGDRLVVETADGTIVNGVPAALPQTFWAASLELARSTVPGSVWERDGDTLRLRDADGTVQRRVPLVDGQHLAVNWHSRWFTGFPEQWAQWETLAAAEAATGEANWDLNQIARDAAGWIAAAEAEDPRALAPLRPWGEPNDPFNPQVSIADVLFLYDAYLLAVELEATRAMGFIRELFAQFDGCHILIGPTDILLQDVAPTPFDENPVPKVAVHGNLLKTLLDDRFLRYAPGWMEPVWVLAIVLAIGSITMRGGRNAWRWQLLGAAVLGFFGLLAIALFSWADYVLPMATPLGAGATAGGFGLLMRLVSEEQQRRRLRGLFGTYVSPDVVRLMVDSAEEPQLGGHVRQITAFFSDIESFASIGEQLPPDVLVELMNTYLDAMTARLAAERGTLDKYIGDAIVGIFGAPLSLPDHAARACVAALRMQQEQARLRALWQQTTPPWPARVREMQTRIGLHTGAAVVGNMGSRQRFAYTMMGDTVNLAARLEQLGKSYGVYLIVSEETRRQALETEPHLVFRLLDLVAVKGRRQPVRVYELMGLSESLKGSQFQCLSLYESAFEAYLERAWEVAAKRFAAALEFEARREAPINPSRLLRERCQIYGAMPPAVGWDGTYVMTRK